LIAPPSPLVHAAFFLSHLCVAFVHKFVRPSFPALTLASLVHSQVTTLSIAAGCIYISLVSFAVALLRAYVLSADMSSEGPIIITWVRCSCCSRQIKKLVSLMPFVGLAATGVTATAVEWHDKCEQPLHEFLVASSVVFLLYAVIGGFIFWGKKKFKSGLVLCMLVANIAFGFGTSIAGIIFVSKSSSACVSAAPRLYATAVAMKAACLSTTLFVAVFACCCKVEQCILFDDEELVHYSEKPVWRNSEQAKKNLRSHPSLQ